jgi:hypothetical protein
LEIAKQLGLDYSLAHKVCSYGERTVEEYADLLKNAGWSNIKTLYSHSGQMGVVQASK